MKPQRGKTPGKKTPAPSRRPNSKMTDPVEVFCRVRPLDDPNGAVCAKVLGPTTVQLTSSENSHAYKNAGIIKETQNTFNFVFDECSSQKALFDHVALPMVEDILHGKNALLFAYGVTSSGKTYTMTGSPQDPGILPRCLDVIFNSIKEVQARKYVFKPDRMNGFDIQTDADAMLERQRREVMPRQVAGLNTPRTPAPKDRDIFDSNTRLKDMSKVEDIDEDSVYSVFLSYVEIYNNYVYDLLEEIPYDPITGYKTPQSKIPREDSNGRIYISGAIEVEVKSTEEAYEVVYKGQKRRKVAHTALNTESSRSHSVLNIRLVQAPLDPQGEDVLQDKDRVCFSQLSLVDLAGSERTGRTCNTGERLKEAGNINQSLLVLRTCIEALRENQKNGSKKLVPYRDSKVTHLFKNYFEGEGKVRMIVCVNPTAEEYDETINVMKFAEMTQEVQVARAETVRYNLGLTPGRMRNNLKYKDAISKGTDPNMVVPPPMIYSMGPPFPVFELLDPRDDVLFPSLAEFLHQRERRRKTLMLDIGTKEEAFRSRLLGVEKENTDLRQRNQELEAALQGKNGECSKYQRRVHSLEKRLNDDQRMHSQVRTEKDELERELGMRDWKIQQTTSEKDRIKQDYRAKLVLTEQNFNRHLETTKKKMKEETLAQLRSKQHKLELLRNIINGESDAESANGRVNSSRYGTRSTLGQSRLYPATSEPDLSSQGPAAGSSTPRVLHTRAMTAYTQPVQKAVPRTSRAKSPPPTKPKPVVNPRYHRRSKSSHEVWLDHKPAGTVDTGTISQPKLNKKKSVTKLTEKNTKEANKYLLTHQGMDSDGDFATKLVKGDIMPTSSGGSAVIFNDVETIKQTSPGDRKRRSDNYRPEDFEGEWTDTEDRCRIATEGHGHLKRVKTSQV